ncbi:scarecrow-like protein 6 [Mangifera indica]|uniref:scarecrow-like protein 6 n=1 Tax=Mangifera indica TaxID=29780 RepID=UPI001CF95DFE|nr:scarecrow-like protein 6 [Mangifera indica]
MRGLPIPFHLQEKGAFEIQDFTSICSQDKWKKKQQQENSNNNSFFSCSNNNEPTSVLHMRRSQSPPTSASTLSSSLNNTTTITTNDNPTAIPQELVASLVNNERKDEWAAELQQIPSGLEVINSGGERCGLGLDDWESMLSETSQEQSILRWIAGDVDDASFGLKQLLQSGGNGNNPFVEFDGNAGSNLGIIDQGSIFESIGGGLVSGNVDVTNLGAFSGSGFASNNNGNGNGKIAASSSGLVNHKVVGLHSNNSNNMSNANFGSSGNNNMPMVPMSLPPGVIDQRSQSQKFEIPEEKPQILNPQILMNHQQQHQQVQSQNPNFMLPSTYSPLQQELPHLLQPQPKRHNSRGASSNLSPHHVPKPPFSDPAHELFLRNQQQQQQQQMGFSQNVQFLPHHLQQKPLMMTTKPKVLGPGSEEMIRQQHALLDQLYKAAELVGTGNFVHAHGILARLNHLLSPAGKPFQRAAFYFKEALQLLLLINNPAPPPRTPTPFDVIFKMGAYKVFSEVSPIIQFVNFTCNQALLEALDDADRIHIVDFDIGFGAQWASFMQELPMRCNRSSLSLKITAFASPSTHHPVELELMRDNLTQFANEIGISFELDVVNFDLLEQNSYTPPIFRSNENEAVAVNFPVWSYSNQPSALPSLLHIVKQLSPKIVVSSDRGCERNDLSFPDYVLHALQSYINLLESIDAANVNYDTVNKIEKFLLQPRIENSLLGRVQIPDRVPLWKTLIASAGFSPVTFSNFTETQAECVVRRTPVRGFHVEKHQASLVLFWQCRELISVSAWRC